RFQLKGGALVEWHNFIRLLENLPVHVVSLGSACVVCPLHPSDSFTVGSLRAALKKSAFLGLDDFSYSIIWQKEVPTKVQGFMDVFLHEESVSHIFLSCSFAQKVWRLFSSTLSIFGPNHHRMQMVIEGWKVLNCDPDFVPMKRCLLHASAGIFGLSKIIECL
ncbi:hypothetical protein LINGRAHAP2_LOCUS3924, partial [Linum grandiflorum]